MRVLIVFVAALVSAAPAEAACRPEPDGAPVRVALKERGAARLIACDARRGRRIVLARGGRGIALGDPAVAGRRVVWLQARRSVVRLHVVRVGRRVRRVRTSVVARLRRQRGPVALAAMITSRGELAWLIDTALWVQRPGRRPRRIARGFFADLRLEDDRTLRLEGDGEYRYFDLRGQREPACGGRSRFRTVLDTETVVVTQAHYERFSYTGTAIRACLRATGRDPVVVSSPDTAFFDYQVLGVDGEWVRVREIDCVRECLFLEFEVQAGTGRIRPVDRG